MLGEEDVNGRDRRFGSGNSFNERRNRGTRPRPRSDRVERPAIDVHDNDTRARVVVACRPERVICCKHEIECGLAKIFAPAFRQQQAGRQHNGERGDAGHDR